MKRYSTIKDNEQFKLDDSGSYDDFSDDYHECVDKLSKPFVEHMVDLSNVKPGQKILDVGTGSGIVANCAAKKVENSGSVIGIDLSEGMLKTSTETAARLGIKNIQYLHMDAENLDLDTESFDSVLSMCAMDHFPNHISALKEMYRVLKPSGNLVVSIGCRIPPWGGGRLKALKVGVKRAIAQRFESHLYAPNFILGLMQKHLGHLPIPPHSSWGGTDPGKNLVKLIKKADFSVTNLIWKRNMIQVKTVEEFWRFQISIVTEVRKRLQIADKKTIESFNKDFNSLTEKVIKQRGNLYYCGAVFMVKGVKI